MRIGLGMWLGMSAGAFAPPDAVAPTLVSAVINAAGTTLTLTYDEALDETSVPALGDLDIDGPVLAALTGTPAVVGTTVTCSITPAVIAGESVTVDYVPGTNKIKDLAGNLAGSLTAQAVTNNSTHLYDPRDEGAAVLWIDLQDAASYTEVADMVTAITNKISSTSYAALTIGAPHEDAGLNGHPCMHPTLTTHTLVGTEAAVLAALTGAVAYTLAWYGSYDTADPAGREDFFSVGAAGVGTNARFWGHTATGGGRQTSVTVNNAATTVSATSGADNSLAAGHSVIWRSPGTKADCKVNDAAPDPNDAAQDPIAGGASSLTPTQLTINARRGATVSEQLVGRTGELWLFSNEKSDAACTRIEDYLAARWAA
jgi:hypothetical protein